MNTVTERGGSLARWTVKSHTEGTLHKYDPESDSVTLRIDPDLETIRRSPAFAALIKEFKQPADK
jgi:hypothetical protein